MDNRQGEWWLLAQIVLILLHALPPLPAPASLGLAWPPFLVVVGLILLGLGLVLAAASFLNLGASLSPLPDPKPGAALVTDRAYGRCRHPLYQAVLICSLGVCLALGSLVHLLLLLGLAGVLGGKARREERGLISSHPGYAAYRLVTPAIVAGLPWLDWRR
ncbi:S-isoprenylcysteine methyltransferase [Synechococcus sp. CS-1325]|nr:S-isoprenylcysteine methyltransferase [Synechococcus sp. CS-1325]MCT0212016.1 S-isoprenylcysteine methyltransferase [Synechococcus sp. CS-1326]MCT0232426.1 S-isoprenylcysteine methyltransferase [Synechococcus sp. CS-1327]PZU99064.1 MAG: S-isoprenylcysteine methyltransferase [Cyanobium sp.]